jgi:hypothetical protein
LRTRRRSESPRDGAYVIRLVNPVAQHYETFIRSNAPHAKHVVVPGSAKGQHLILCGAGPTLKEHAAEWCDQGHQVWGCNSALPWLAENGYRVTHGFTVDQTDGMLSDWATPPRVGYLVATSIHPHLREHLHARGLKLRWFHNWVGVNKPPVVYAGERMSYEDALYHRLFQHKMPRAGFGLNSVTRAIDIALVMGFARITVLGADCALAYDAPPPPGMVPGSMLHNDWRRDHCTLHANGGAPDAAHSTTLLLSGRIDGRHWETKTDMMVTAVALVKKRRLIPNRLELIGDTLPNALRDKDDAYLDRLPTLVQANGEPVPLT